MCLAVPGRIARIVGAAPSERTAEVVYGSETRSAHLLYLPEARVGDWVLVQSGYATSRLEEADALAALASARELFEGTIAVENGPRAAGSSRSEGA